MKSFRNRTRQTSRAAIFTATLGLFFTASYAQAEGHSYLCGCAGCASGGTATSDSSEIEFFRILNRWDDNDPESRGDAITLTYGVVPDDTEINGTGVTGEDEDDSSNLVNFLNTNIGSSAVWQPLIDDAYQRWGELSGVTMIHQPLDDGAAMGSGGASGSDTLGSERPDMRIGGRSLDGGSGVLAYNYFPDNGDQVIDTDDSGFYSNSTNNYRALRNVLMHEAGHGLGFSHLESNNSSQLMEPFISTNPNFDGPQHDDILAAQRNYGDAWEKNGGNDDTANATSAGTFTGPLQTWSIGTDADDTAFVGADEIDFISIDGTSDVDVFSFTLDGGVDFDISILLDPKGPEYNEGPQGGTQNELDTEALTNLQLELLDDLGSVLFSADANGAGFSELIDTILAPGDYFARVSTAEGAVDDIQMYQLDISAEFVPEPTSMVMLALGGLLLFRRRRG